MFRDDKKLAELAAFEYSNGNAGSHRETDGATDAFLQAERLAGIVISAREGIITIDESQRILLFNHAAGAMFLCPAAEAIAQPIGRFIPELSRAADSQHISDSGCTKVNGLATGAPEEIRGLRANGEEFPVEVLISQSSSGGQKLYTILLRDITERKNMEEELRDLGARLLSLQDEERRRVAKELYDNLNQLMAILSIDLLQLDREIPEPNNALHARVQDLWSRSQEISSEIRRLSYQLHPSKLDHLGLEAAVKGLCNEASEHHSLKTEFRHSGFPAALPKEISLCIFRIAQESLHNVIKHSGACEALVVLEKSLQAVRLSVSDEGCGFDRGAARTKRGLGLISMRERLRPVGGEILISSQPSRGTRIDVSVPLVTR